MHSNAAVLAFSLILLTLPLALAQDELDPVVAVGAGTPASLELGPNATATVRFTITNTGPTEATVSTVGASAPTGWLITSVEPSGGFTLTANTGSRDVTVTLGIGPHSDSIKNGPLTVTATWTSARPMSGDSPSGSIPLTYLAPEAPAPAPPPKPTPWGAILSGVFGSMFLIGGAAYVGQARRVEIAPEEGQQPITVGCDGVYKVVVKNPSARAQTVELRIKELPIDWFAAFSFPKVTLGPKETTVVPLLVRVPWGAAAGAVGHVTFQARPNTFSPWLRTGSVQATVIDVGKPGASTTGYAA